MSAELAEPYRCIVAPVADALLDGIGPRIGLYRDHHGMTRAELAAAAGMTVEHLAMVEDGQRLEPHSLVKPLASALDVDVSALSLPPGSPLVSELIFIHLPDLRASLERKAGGRRMLVLDDGLVRVELFALPTDSVTTVCDRTIALSAVVAQFLRDDDGPADGVG